MLCLHRLPRLPSPDEGAVAHLCETKMVSLGSLDQGLAVCCACGIVGYMGTCTQDWSKDSKKHLSQPPPFSCHRWKPILIALIVA